jgi:PAS domain S-box-containing protein
MKKKNAKADEFKGLRAKAEKKLNQKIVKLREKSQGDPEKVLHELRVHQIELEMQNEELREAQAELEQSRNKYTDLYDFAPVGYFTFDKHGLVIEANLTGCQMLGVERANLIKKPFRSFVSKESQDAFYLHREAALTPGLKQSCEIELIRKDGDKFYALLESIPAANEKGEFAFCRTAITDITERKKMELVLKDISNEVANEKNRLEAVMEALLTGVAIIDSKGANVHSNAAFEQVWGGPPPPTRNIKDYAKYKAWNPDTGKPVKPEEWAAAIAVKKGKAVKNQLFEIQRFDGSRGFVLNSAAPVRDADGKITGSAVAIMDITGLRKAQEALREQHTRLQLSAEAGGIGAWDLDLVNNKLLWDAKCRKMFGVAPEKEITYKLFFSLIYPEDRKIAEQAVSQCSAEHKEYDIEYRAKLPDGSIHWFFAKGLGFFDNAGKCLRMSGVVMDVTERKLAEEKVRQSQKTFSELVERAPFGIYIVDSQFRIANMNVASQNGAFKNVRPLIGRPFNEAMHTLWPDDVAEGIIANFRHTLDTGEPYYSPPFFNPRHDIEIIEGYEWELHRMTLPDGQFGVICYYFDSTKLREAEGALRKSNEDLERFNRIATGRELRIIEMKKEVNEFCRLAGQAKRYPLDFEKENENEKGDNRTT